jgi:hypothetical protein
MGIELDIRITSPLNAEDRELLSGIAVMTLAIANHEMAKAAFPDAFGDDEEAPEEVPWEPQPCASADPTGTMLCIGVVGHRGRHKFRRVEAVGTGLAN